MDSIDRVNNAFNHKDADRTPIFEYVLTGNIPSVLLNRKHICFNDADGGWDARVKENGLINSVDAYVKDRLDLARILNHDLLYVYPNPPAVSGIAPNIPVKDLYAGDPVEHMRLRNEKRLNNIDNGICDPDGIFYVYESINREMRIRNAGYELFAPAYFHGVWTDTDLMQTMLLDPETARIHFGVCTELCFKRMDLLKQYGIKIVGIGGDFAGNRPIISAESYRAFIMPEIKKCADYARKLGMWAVNTSDGALWYVIDDFLINTGVDAYMEIDMGAGMDLQKLKSGYGDKITFMGNMDCGNALSFMDCASIRELTVSCIEYGWGDGGHIFTASNAITDSVPVQNYLAMVNAYNDYFSLPVIKI